jgi:type IV secretory pathway ATPase VirB11/archaellum biosynthesis ATPase
MSSFHHDEIMCACTFGKAGLAVSFDVQSGKVPVTSALILDEPEAVLQRLYHLDLQLNAYRGKHTDQAYRLLVDESATLYSDLVKSGVLVEYTGHESEVQAGEKDEWEGL